jgi:PAS domain S-box-containing protein
VARHVDFVLEQGADTFETKHKTKAGDVRDVLVTTRAVSVRGTKLIASIWHDITERKRAEQALRRERDFSTSLLQASPTFFVAINAKGVTLMMNDAMLETLGYTKEEVVGTNYLETFVPQPDRKLAARIFDKLIHSRVATLNENRVLTKDGRQLLVEWRGRPMFKEDGAFDFFFGVGIDVTERRQAERERAKLEEQLRHVHKMQAVGQLAAGVAHDFNSVLAVVLGNAELLRSECKRRGLPDPKNAISDALGHILNSVERGRKLVQSLLTFGRTRSWRPRPLNLNNRVDYVRQMLEGVLGAHIELEVLKEQNLKTINADAGQMEQVLVNLLLNARDAMPDGGELTIETANADLDEAYVTAHAEAHPGPHVCLRVSDTGAGMDGSTLKRLFEPFFTTKPMDQGTGLGLSIVYGIVTQANGHITVASDVGKGTTFALYFPATE